MNSYKSLLVIIGLFISCFLLGIVETYFFYNILIFPYFIAVCITIIIIYLLIKRIKINKYVKIFVFIVCIIILLSDYKIIKCKINLFLFKDKYNEIIEMVNKNEIETYDGYNAKLPKYSYLSSDKEISIYNLGDDNVVGFWIYRGISISSSMQIIFFDSKETRDAFLEENMIKKYYSINNSWYIIYI